MHFLASVILRDMVFAGWMFSLVLNGFAQIEPATDGPRPMSPDEAIHSFKLPQGFQMELVASEPLIEEPSGVCWDEHGNLYVCELHGYNLEGQYDIDALNKTGKLDRIVRRIQADDEAKNRAELETFGRIKQLSDTDGDGRMDHATLFASGLPPCFGMVAAREGIIVICAPDIYYLADLDNDGVADVRERLFTGFRTGVLERRINAPQWGLDNWIYIGANGQSDAITGPYLKAPVALGRTDFRIKADGSAIEPVLGSTGTFGHTFTAEGDRLTISTGTPGYQVIPLPWRYLARNPELPTPSTERNAANYQITYPASNPHPWRTRRYNDPGFSKYYTDHYGKAESIPNGYLTSACSPFIYRDIAFPESYRGHNFSCEPAQNLIHHSIPQWVGPELHLRRGENESEQEFLASSDTWFHPMNLSHGPDGAMYITDFYREIIEDYSAIPRYLQQLYGLTNGMHHGRIWRLTHQSAPKAPSTKMSHLFDAQLANEVGSPHAWRRETARRLLIERMTDQVHSALIEHLNPDTAPEAAINALYTLEGLNALNTGVLKRALNHKHWSVKRHALRIGDALPPDSTGSIETAEWLSDIVHYGQEPRLLLQIALSLGSYTTEGALNALAYLAEQHSDIRWMDTAIGSSVYQREEALLGRILHHRKPNESLAEQLVAAIATRGNRIQIQKAQASVKFLAKPPHRETYTRILESALVDAQETLERIALEAPELPDEATLKKLESKLPDYLKALENDTDMEQGRELFTEHCSSCHQAGGLGKLAGPNLDSEFQRAPETIVRDILFPNETITEGFETIQLEMRRGTDAQGLMASESPTSVTLRFPGGQELTFLRNRIDRIRSHKVSIMPAQFGELLTPKEVANIVAFIRQHRSDEP
jgi:putative membrane-bound dehydrogenase-like protein